MQSAAQARIEKLDAPPPPAPAVTPAHIDLTCVRFSSELLDTVPREIAEQYGVLPVYVRRGRKKRREPAEPSTLYIATASPEDPAALEDCALCSNMKVRVFLAASDQIRQAIPVVYAGEPFDGSAPSQPTPKTPTGSMPELPLIRPPVRANGPPPPLPQGIPNSTPHVNGSSAPASTPAPISAVGPTGSAAAPACSPAVAALVAPGAPVLTSVPTAGRSLVLDPILDLDVDSDADEKPALSLRARAALVPPRVMVVGATPDLLDYCQEALAPLGGQVEAREMGRAAEMMNGGRPHLVLVPEEIYPFDRRAFNLLAFQLGAPLVVWSLDMDPADLQALLLASRCAPLASIPPPAG